MTAIAPRDLTYIGHMLDSIARIRQFVGRKRRAGFLGSRLVQDAVIRNVEIIGEAAGQLSPELIAGHGSIPWRKIIGMRHRLIHGYVQVDLQTVWDVVARDLPALEKKLLALVPVSPPAASRPRARRRR